MDMPVNVPVDNPQADTEWNDILRKHGIIPEKPSSPTLVIEEALFEAERLAHANRLEEKSIEELKELEDDEDEGFLEHYRKKRMSELSTIAKSSIYNHVYPLQKPDYAKDVTDASDRCFVIVLMTSSIDANMESVISEKIWHDLAAQYGDIKFCQIRANLCIEGYPERNTPTILIYKDKDIKKQIVTLKELNGGNTKLEDLEKVLMDVGAIRHNDPRVRRLPKHDFESKKNCDDDWE